MAAGSISSKGEDVEYSKNGDVSRGDEDFGGTEERQRMEKKLLRKLDTRMSILVVIYILNYVSPYGPLVRLAIFERVSRLQIDRNNASAARLRGFEADLHLKGQQFATILSILYVGYILMQIPSYVLFSLTS